MLRARLLCVAATSLALMAACTGSEANRDATSDDTASAASSAPATVGDGPSRPAHVLVVIFENEDASDVVSDADAPYLTSARPIRASRTTWPCSPARPTA